MNKRAININDVLLALSVFLLIGGTFGGALRPIRVFAIVLFPMVIINAGKIQQLKNLLVTFFLFLLYCVISLIWSLDRGEGLKEILYYFIHFSLFFEIVILASKAKKPLKSLSVGWFLFVLVCSFIAVWELLTGNHLPMAYEDTNYVHAENVIMDRMVASVTFSNFNGYVTALCFAMPWLYYGLIMKPSNPRVIRLLTLLLIAVSALTILIDGSRGGVITMVCMALIFLFKYNGIKKKLLVTVFVIAILSFFLIKYHDEIFLVFSMRQTVSSEFQKSGGAYGGRIAIWILVLRSIFYNMGLGVGCGSMAAFLEAHKGGTDIALATHNLFFEILLVFGIIWFFLFVRFIFRLLKRTNKINEDQRRIPLQLALWTMPIYCIIDSTYLLDPLIYVSLATIFIFVNGDSLVLRKTTRRIKDSYTKQLNIDTD